MHVCAECGLGFDQPGFCPDDGQQLRDAGRDPLLGTTIGAYRVASVLGAGGMGIVYRGIHPEIGSRVAIKVLGVDDTRAASHSPSQSSEHIDRFFAEARAVNMVRHENIVNIMDFARLADGRPYMVMEFLDGCDLGRLIELRGALPMASFGNLLLETLSAVAAAHATGVVHRDLKPENIFVTPSGHARVLDFGVAKLDATLNEQPGHTKTGSLLGTPYYMSPEQARGDRVDHRADIYAMGAILYEGICGDRPFEGKTLFEILSKHCDAAPPSPRKLRADLPKNYEKVILRALEKSPDARFQSAEEMADALREAVEKLPTKEFAPLHDAVESSFGDKTVKQAGHPAHTPNSSSSPDFHSARDWAVSQRAKPKTGWIVGGIVALSMVTFAAALAFGPWGEEAKEPQSEMAQLAHDAAPAVESDHDATSLSPPAPDDDPTDPVKVVASSSSSSGGEASPSSSGGQSSSSSGSSSGPGGPSTGGKTTSSSGGSSSEGAGGKTSSSSGGGTTSSGGTSVKNVDNKTASPGADTVAGAHMPELTDAVKATMTEEQIEAYESMRKPKLETLDGASLARRAGRRADKELPDAKLKAAYYYGINSNGEILTQFTQMYNPAMFMYVSESLAKPQPGEPLGGVPESRNCELVVSFNKGGGITVSRSGSPERCMAVTQAKPRCTPKQVWKKAQAKGAPTANAVAEITYFAAPDGQWSFEIDGVFDTIQLPDDC